MVRISREYSPSRSNTITGGSTFSGKQEQRHIRAYLESVGSLVGRENIAGEILLYITPPEDCGLLDEYLGLGADRIACSLEVWEEGRAAVITPGKMKFTTRERHLKALEYVAERYGPGKAFSNFIIGLEPVETLRQGAQYLAERGILPGAT